MCCLPSIPFPRCWLFRTIPLCVYTSNILAVLGLRSLYFALASLLDRFRYLHYGLAALLGFCGAEDAGSALDRSADHDFAGGDGGDFGGVRGGVVDGFRQRSGFREQRPEIREQRSVRGFVLQCLFSVDKAGKRCGLGFVLSHSRDRKSRENGARCFCALEGIERPVFYSLLPGRRSGFRSLTLDL